MGDSYHIDNDIDRVLDLLDIHRQEHGCKGTECPQGLAIRQLLKALCRLDVYT
jgi:hypothetical protein